MSSRSISRSSVLTSIFKRSSLPMRLLCIS
jgi:hypothetical protein